MNKVSIHKMFSDKEALMELWYHHDRNTKLRKKYNVLELKEPQHLFEKQEIPYTLYEGITETETGAKKHMILTRTLEDMQLLMSHFLVNKFYNYASRDLKRNNEGMQKLIHSLLTFEKEHIYLTGTIAYVFLNEDYTL